jgi:nitroimidazol reductase NimA-like FMN-containing flavoprotein (pyridoxamine 5'-phosphate oxidase superfamily)
MNVREMRHADCMDLLSKSSLGRLACCKGNIPYLVPIQFRYAENRIRSFSLAGQKIEWMRANPNVCLEVEHFVSRHQWKCLLVQGQFQEQATQEQRDYAWSVLQEDNDWWEPGALKPNSPNVGDQNKPVYYTIAIDSITGREALGV